MTKKKTLLAGIVIGICSIALVASSATAITPSPVLLPYCATEDAKNCYWDAQVQGNGQGQSFVNIGNITYYLP